jgi:hypothetical protein
MMRSAVNDILQSARIAELREEVLEVAELAKSPPVVELPRGKRGRLRLVRLLARERRRNARLVAVIHG